MRKGNNMARQYENLTIGTAVYYTGDMANASAYGTVVAIRAGNRWGNLSYDVEFEDGRSSKGISPLAFEPGPGRRFWLLSEWTQDRNAKIAAMKAAYEALMAKRALA